ncbi:uncharacterized protein LOC113520268 [Galleria mellonella]|uniref:Uncharacterized protein LOC113520268 n=1 Tax=Galleria mellonella TaxID=7137 RepID=A0A6J1X5A7_GALME|nr:uncharacterized protein LOC113520268 [Galleria mellonella]
MRDYEGERQLSWSFQISTIAEKLCKEIVDPALKSSSKTPAEKSRHITQQTTSNRQDGRSTRSIVIEKKKEINKLIPRNNTSAIVGNKFKSKETILKKNFVDIACNTLVTGPLRCDIDCVTMVRKRDNHCTCKCAHKRVNSKASVKQVQTYDIRNYGFTDKACTQYVETLSCGTQFLEKLTENRSRFGSKTKADQHSVKEPTENGPNLYININRGSNICRKIAKRWAISRYPVRGPDF